MTFQKFLAAEFPDYAALSNPLPMTAKEIRALLSDDEAIVLFAAADTETYVFALTRDSSDWRPIPLGVEAVSRKAEPSLLFAFQRSRPSLMTAC